MEPHVNVSPFSELFLVWTLLFLPTSARGTETADELHLDGPRDAVEIGLLLKK